MPTVHLDVGYAWYRCSSQLASLKLRGLVWLHDSTLLKQFSPVFLENVFGLSFGVDDHLDAGKWSEVAERRLEELIGACYCIKNSANTGH